MTTNKTNDEKSWEEWREKTIKANKVFSLKDVWLAALSHERERPFKNPTDDLESMMDECDKLTDYPTEVKASGVSGVRFMATSWKHKAKSGSPEVISMGGQTRREAVKNLLEKLKGEVRK